MSVSVRPVQRAYLKSIGYFEGIYDPYSCCKDSAASAEKKPCWGPHEEQKLTGIEGRVGVGLHRQMDQKTE